jgi:CspA family cold shock protein
MANTVSCLQLEALCHPATSTNKVAAPRRFGTTAPARQSFHFGTRGFRAVRTPRVPNQSPTGPTRSATPFEQPPSGNYLSNKRGFRVSEFGTVTAVNARGFFFIRPDYSDGGKDIFCHMSEVERGGLRRPERGDKFEYEIKSTPRGPQATDLKPVM